MTDGSFLDELTGLARQKSPEALAVDEGFWGRLAREYERDERFIQLNYGYYHPSLRPVLEVEIAAIREINRGGSHFKWQESERLLEAARADLARLARVDAGELVITRNASEALNLVIQGVALEPGDEVVCSDQDYGAMEQAWEQRARHGGIRLRKVVVPLDPVDDGQILRLFEAEMTPRTRLVHLTHLIHFTGQILPVQALCALARRRGIPVLVDAAHSFAQIDFSIRDLGCDYLGASLHKWLGAPLGTGMLWVRKDRIAGLRPLFGDTHYPGDDIRRLERFGNRPDSAHAGIREAIRWHEAIGVGVKQARLAHLQRSWAEPLRARERFRVLTPRAAGRHGAIGLLNLAGVAPEALFDYLLREQHIFTVVQKNAAVGGVRVTPGLPTSQEHIDRLNEALQAAAAHFA
jgi:selenocysteine lyase/cysteine desulfurase